MKQKNIDDKPCFFTKKASCGSLGFAAGLLRISAGIVVVAGVGYFLKEVYHK
ncbi:MAG: hypothetical protein MUO63_21045 [Desulfobulbaceae bacterium]|nr:hypothetical protein [Desulfobulbaceae bacterium]